MWGFTPWQECLASVPTSAASALAVYLIEELMIGSVTSRQTGALTERRRTSERAVEAAELPAGGVGGGPNHHPPSSADSVRAEGGPAADFLHPSGLRRQQAERNGTNFAPIRTTSCTCRAASLAFLFFCHCNFYSIGWTNLVRDL